MLIQLESWSADEQSSRNRWCRQPREPCPGVRSGHAILVVPRTNGERTAEAKGGHPCMWRTWCWGRPGRPAAQRGRLDRHPTDQAAGTIAWHEQQHAVGRGGMVLTIEVNPQPAQGHLPVLTTQVVCARRRMQSGVTEPEDHRLGRGPWRSEVRARRSTSCCKQPTLDSMKVR